MTPHMAHNMAHTTLVFHVVGRDCDVHLIQSTWVCWNLPRSLLLF